MTGPKYLSTMDDWMRDQEKRITSVERRRRRVPAGGGGGQTTISVSDTGTIDMILTGDPTTGYGLSSNVTAVPVALLTGPGTIPPALLPTPPTPTTITVTDTATIDLTVSGGPAYTLSGAVIAVPVSLLTGPGTIAPALLPAATPTPLTVTDTATIDLTLTGAGTAASPWNLQADVIGGGGTGTPVTVTWNANFRNSVALGPPVINKIGTKVIVDRFTAENATTMTLGTNGQIAAGTLPSGSWPTVEVRFPASLNVAGNFMAIGQVLISTAGAITLQTNQPFTSVAAGNAIWACGAISWVAA